MRIKQGFPIACDASNCRPVSISFTEQRLVMAGGRGDIRFSFLSCCKNAVQPGGIDATLGGADHRGSGEGQDDRG